MKKYFWFVILFHEKQIGGGIFSDDDGYSETDQKIFKKSGSDDQKTFNFILGRIRSVLTENDLTWHSMEEKKLSVTCVENSQENKEMAKKLKTYLLKKLQEESN
jgi:hypothetical protein